MTADEIEQAVKGEIGPDGRIDWNLHDAVVVRQDFVARIAALVNQAVAAEREACAKAAEEGLWGYDHHRDEPVKYINSPCCETTCERIAYAIRARKE